MPQRDMAKEQRWRNLISKWKSSGLSKAEFCRQNDIPDRHLANWIRITAARDAELRRENSKRSIKLEPAAARQPEFAEIKIATPPPAPVAVQNDEKFALEVVLRNGICLRLKSDSSSKTLSSLISALESC